MRGQTITALLICGWVGWGAPDGARAEDTKATADPAMAAYMSANGMLNRGLYELAAAEYRTFLAANPTHEKAAIARYGLGVCLFRTGHLDEAVKELTPLASRDNFEFAAEVATILGQCHLAGKQYPAAVDAFRKALRAGDDHPLADDASAGLAESLYLDQKHVEAAAQSQEFVNRWPDGPLRERVEFFGGLAELARGEFVTASRSFESVLERYPKGAFAEQASLLLAQCYQNNNNDDKAVQQYRKAIKRAGDQPSEDALWGLATTLLRQENHAEAAKLLDQFIEKFPRSSRLDSARFQRGRVYFGENRFDRALELFDKVAAAEGELQDQGTYWAAKCRIRQNEFADAARRLESGIERFPQSPLSAEMMYDRGIALLRAEKADEALAVLRVFLAKYPQHSLAADALHLAAVTAHQRGRYEESGEHCRAFLSRFAEHKLASEVAFVSAENLVLSENYEQAVNAYIAFLDTFPASPLASKATFRLGNCLYRLDRYEEAQPHLAKVAGASGSDPLFRPARLALGDIAFQRQEWKQAEAELTRYLDGGDDMASADDALLKLGLARQRQDHHMEAIEAFRRLIERSKDSPHRGQALFERGQSLVALEEWDDAARAFETLLADDPASRFAPYALNHLASIATQRKDFAKAADLLDRAARSDSDAELTAEAELQRAQVLMAGRRFAEAEAAYARFLQRHGSHARAAEARAQRAIALARQDKHKEAVEAIAELERSGAAGLEADLLNAVRYEKAWCLRELGDSNGAAAVYRELLAATDTGPLRLHGLVELAGLEANAKRCDEAVRLFHQFVTAVGGSSAAEVTTLREQAAYRLAACEFELEHWAESAELFDAFVRDFPDSQLVASAGYQAGEAYHRIGRFEQSVKALARVTERFRDDPVYGPALLRLGDSLAMLKRWPASERAFADYLERFPDREPWFQARLGVGWARENQQRYADAIDAYQAVVARHKGPTSARAQFQIGECLFAQQKYEEAARELLKVDILYAYPEWSAAALYEAGRCFEKLGKPGEARSQFSIVADKHKGTQWAELAAQRLSELSSAASPPGHSR